VQALGAINEKDYHHKANRHAEGKLGKLGKKEALRWAQQTLPKGSV